MDTSSQCATAAFHGCRSGGASIAPTPDCWGSGSATASSWRADSHAECRIAVPRPWRHRCGSPRPDRLIGRSQPGPSTGGPGPAPRTMSSPLLAAAVPVTAPKHAVVAPLPMCPPLSGLRRRRGASLHISGCRRHGPLPVPGDHLRVSVPTSMRRRSSLRAERPALAGPCVAASATAETCRRPRRRTEPWRWRMQRQLSARLRGSPRGPW
jgi:hypothetical protein